MKRRIVLGLAIFTSVFVLGGIYLIVTIEKTTTTLYKLLDLHRVEILREQLLINARSIESGLTIKNNRPEGTLDSLISNVVRMETQADRCLECHHSAAADRSLRGLKAEILAYEAAARSFFDTGTDTGRLEDKRDQALERGRKLVGTLHDMISLTHAKLDERTEATLTKISDMKTMIFMVIILGPLVAVGLAVVFIKGFTRPLSLLLQATRKLKSGDLSFRVQDLRDEFGEMAAAFNEMAVALRDQMQSMQRAEQMTMAGEMAANLVHEIKNPLTGIKGAMQIVQQGSGTSEEDRAILAMAVEEVKKVESLLKDLLNFATPPKPQFLSVNVNDLLEATLNAAMLHAYLSPGSPKSIQIRRHFDTQLPMVMADPMEMQQVFLNLLMNAVQAMPSGGTVTVRTCEGDSPEEIDIEISDTGTGIDEEMKERIFQPFFTTKKKGTGLGLAITRRFIEMHGGTISVEKSSAEGTTFRIRLPSAPAEGEPVADGTADMSVFSKS